MMPHIEIGQVYMLDGKEPVKVLKALNRSKTTFSIETPNNSIETITIDRLLPQPMELPSVSDEEVSFEIDKKNTLRR
jgi:hypothetical protein